MNCDGGHLDAEGWWIPCPNPAETELVWITPDGETDVTDLCWPCANRAETK